MKILLTSWKSLANNYTSIVDSTAHHLSRKCYRCSRISLTTEWPCLTAPSQQSCLPASSSENMKLTSATNISKTFSSIVSRGIHSLEMITKISIRMSLLDGFYIDHVMSLEKVADLVLHCLTDSHTIHISVHLLQYLLIYSIFTMNMPPCDMRICSKFNE